MIFHLGYPKCASTTLQVALAASDSYFLGCNPKAAVGSFYQSDLGNFFENVFRFGTEAQFERSHAPISEKLNKLNQEYRERLVLSFETSVKRVVPFDLPTEIKISRLQRVLPQETTFILLYRPVKSHLFSQYRDFLLSGYAQSFESFMEEMSVVWDFGFVSDLSIRFVIEQLSKEFPNSKVILSDLRNADSISRLLSYVNINVPQDRFDGIVNEGISSKNYKTHLTLNRSLQNFKGFLDHLEVHRVFPDSPVSDELKFKYARIRLAHRQTRITTKNEDGFNADEYPWPRYVEELCEDNALFVSAIKGDSRVVHL
jgi:hypothetical protein